jgi:hypothetical protein
LKKIILKSGLCIGDHLIMGMAIQSLHYQLPKEYETYVDIPQKEIFENNPFIKNAPPFESGEVIKMNYPLIHRSGRISYCFAESYVQYLGEKLNIPLRLQCNKCDLFLTDEEKNKYTNFKPYWIVVSGGKNDYTAKHLSQGILNEVIDNYSGYINFVQPVNNDTHYILKNTKVISNMTIRDMFSLVYNSSGVICPVTSWQHIAGSFDKTCVCIAGAREPQWWIQPYKQQHLLHSVGSLSCCKDPCWKSKVLKENEKDSYCVNPVFLSDQWIPQCIARIKSKEIISLMDRII